MQTRSISDYTISMFSDSGTFAQDARSNLENRYSSIIENNEKFSRKLVSYQANRQEIVHNWFRYKEGFSSALVAAFIDEFGLEHESLIMDPFMGSGTTSLVAQRKGISTVGFDILPVSKLSFDVKIHAPLYDLQELQKLLTVIRHIDISGCAPLNYNSLSITRGAFPAKTESEICVLSKWISDSSFSKEAKDLARFAIMSLLEEISFTRKDGQYLRWDIRSEKAIVSNQRRLAKGRPLIKTILNKGELPTLKERLILLLPQMIDDIEIVQRELQGVRKSSHNLLFGSVLFELPKYPSDSVDCVITSPPYCNRYDYTRTYALELAYLGVDDERIRNMRQDLLTCTVENKSKIKELQSFYESIDAADRFNEIMRAVNENNAFQEVLLSLYKRSRIGQINNTGVIRMVEGYFTELAFVFRELHRVCKSGAHVVFVNDNVRYAGEVVPVDFISTSFAQSFGFTPLKVYVLPQTKGNSSQQMKKFGQVRLRKSITVWKK